MAKATKGLTSKRVEALKEPGRYHDPEHRGLYLQVGPTGTKSWLLRYEHAGRERWHGLGSAADFSLKEARERARRARQLLADGIDPVAAKKAAKAAAALAAAKAVTFEEATRQYYAQHNAKWRSRKHAAQFLTTLEAYALPKIGRLSVADVDTGAVLRCLEPIWPTKTETASRVRGRIESVLDWATVRNYRTGDNPARWKGHLAEVLPARGQIQKTEHQPALQFEQLPGFMQELAKREGVAARALEFAILTGARTDQATTAPWSEIDLDAGAWTIPASRMKAGKELKVPLSDQALGILRDLPREAGNEFIFISPSQHRAGLSNAAMGELLGRMHAVRASAGLPPWVDKTTGKLAVVHGFRSTFRDWAGERTSYPNHVVEMALAHAIGKVERAYQRRDLYDKRVRLMAEWAKFATGPQAGGAVDTSLNERRKARA
jgi:integrase